MKNLGGHYLAVERGAFEPEPVSEPKQQTKVATAPLWESARMDEPTTAWMLSKWRLYGELE